ncbi:MAG: metal ABC transporter permease, partial [Candidatus Omnitrophica bacterium]|nr:metal ABC transporter permease [Candidatus Omnitrophota bacterium]
HAYLGLHVIERQVIFVDLALAQIAAVGASLALVFGLSINSAYSYWMSLGFTILGAAIFSLTRFRKQRVPQEAIIGIVYAVSAALLILILSRSGEGDEQIRQALVGNILLINSKEIIKIFLIYSVIGSFHFYCRRQFLLISQSPEEAFKKGLNVRFWDFLFYVSFGFVVTSSVKIAGVLVVFAFLIVPSTCAILFSNDAKIRLMFGWGMGFFVSALGMAISYFFDLPTGASIVCAFGMTFVVSALAKKLLAI